MVFPACGTRSIRIRHEVGSVEMTASSTRFRSQAGPRKTAKNAGGEDKSEQEILGTSDLPSLITQMINVSHSNE